MVIRKVRRWLKGAPARRDERFESTLKRLAAREGVDPHAARDIEALIATLEGEQGARKPPGAGRHSPSR